MKYKLILGVVLPLVLIVILAIMGSVDIGFTVKEDYKLSLTAEEFSTDSGIRRNIMVGTIKLNNDYFLPKRYDLEPLRACLIDDEENLAPVNAGTIQYSQGEIAPAEGSPLIQKPYYEGTTRSVEVPSYSQETVFIYINPDWTFTRKNTTELMAQYGDYDTIVILEQEEGNRYYYNNCGSISSSEIQDAVRIPLLFQKEESQELNLKTVDLSNINLALNEYCQTLQENVEHSACPTCRTDEMRQVSHFSTSPDHSVTEYTVERLDNAQLRVTLRQFLLYGQNTRTGNIALTFIVDNGGNILSSNLPIAQCL